MSLEGGALTGQRDGRPDRRPRGGDAIRRLSLLAPTTHHFPSDVRSTATFVVGPVPALYRTATDPPESAPTMAPSSIVLGELPCRLTPSARLPTTSSPVPPPPRVRALRTSSASARRRRSWGLSGRSGDLVLLAVIVAGQHLHDADHQRDGRGHRSRRSRCAARAGRAALRRLGPRSWPNSRRPASRQPPTTASRRSLSSTFIAIPPTSSPARRSRGGCVS